MAYMLMIRWMIRAFLPSKDGDSSSPSGGKMIDAQGAELPGHRSCIPSDRPKDHHFCIISVPAHTLPFPLAHSSYAHRAVPPWQFSVSVLL